MRAVKVADEILAARTSGSTSGTHVDDEHPIGPRWRAVQFEWEEVGKLPNAFDCAGRPKIAKLRPFFQIRRAVKTDLAIRRQRNDHHPTPARRVPENFWIPEVFRSDIDHWISRVFRPCAALVIA